MTRNNEVVKKIKQIAGDRLTEVMELKGKSRTEIRHILENEYKYPVQRQTFDKYQRGINWMDKQFILYISEILNIKAGYLLGDDEYQCKTYNGYVSYSEQRDIIGNTPDKYMDLFNIVGEDTGLLFAISIDINRTTPEYFLTDIKDGKTVKLSPNDMEDLYSNVCMYIKKEYSKHATQKSESDKKGTTSNKIKKGGKK